LWFDSEQIVDKESQEFKSGILLLCFDTASADSGGSCRAKTVSGLQREYNHGYTKPMKTAISIPDSIFEEAERLAKIRGWSRSELYSNAVSAYVNSERFLGVREKLDAVYGQNVNDSAVDPFLAKAQARSLLKEKW
jgi:hypothetical protein